MSALKRPKKKKKAGQTTARWRNPRTEALEREMTQIGHDLHTNALAEAVTAESLKKVEGDILKLRDWLGQMDNALSSRGNLQFVEPLWTKEMLKMCLRINNNIEQANGALLMRFKKLAK